MTAPLDLAALALEDIVLVQAQLRENGYHDWPDMLDRVAERVGRLATALEAAQTFIDAELNLRAAAAGGPWSFKEGTLRERLEWCRIQHQLAAETGTPIQWELSAYRSFHQRCVDWYAQMLGQLAALEAAQADKEQLREAHPGEPHEFRTTCLRCGEAGYLNVALITDGEVVRIADRAVIEAKP